MLFIYSIITAFLVMANGQSNKNFEKNMIKNTSIMGLTLCENTLSDVKNKWGHIDSFRVKNCHHCYGICYTCASDCDTIRILFYKNPISDLLGFKLFYASPNDKFADNCLQLHDIEIPLMTKGGLYLGMSKEELIDILAEPQFQEGNEYIYQLSKKIKLPNTKAIFDDVITIKVVIIKDKINILEVTRTITT